MYADICLPYKYKRIFLSFFQLLSCIQTSQRCCSMLLFGAAGSLIDQVFHLFCFLQHLKITNQLIFLRTMPKVKNNNKHWRGLGVGKLMQIHANTQTGWTISHCCHSSLNILKHFLCFLQLYLDILFFSLFVLLCFKQNLFGSICCFCSIKIFLLGTNIKINRHLCYPAVT